MATVDALRSALARLVKLASILAAVILVVYVLLVVFKATPDNDIVKFFRYIADPLAWKFKGIFTPKSPRTRLAVNYILAAVVYLVVGQVISRVVTIGAGARRRD